MRTLEVLDKRSITYSTNVNVTGRAIGQAVSRRLPTMTALVRAQVRTRICGGQSDSGARFLRVLRFPQPVLIPPTDPHSSSLVRCWYNRHISGRHTRWTQFHPPPKKLKKRECDIPILPMHVTAVTHLRWLWSVEFSLEGIIASEVGTPGLSQPER
jgi:hypothetical protein